MPQQNTPSKLRRAAACKHCGSPSVTINTTGKLRRHRASAGGPTCEEGSRRVVPESEIFDVGRVDQLAAELDRIRSANRSTTAKLRRANERVARLGGVEARVQDMAEEVGRLGQELAMAKRNLKGAHAKLELERAKVQANCKAAREAERDLADAEEQIAKLSLNPRDLSTGDLARELERRGEQPRVVSRYRIRHNGATP